MPKVWEILKKFKDLCQFRGWKTSENEDWIQRENEYHSFLFTKDVHPESFTKIASNRKCVIREESSYRVVEASYTAWLLSESPPETLIKMVAENPDLSRRVALYDLSSILEGRNMCAKYNRTDSPVFEEFESFLRRELKAKVTSISCPELSAGSATLAELV